MFKKNIKITGCFLIIFGLFVFLSLNRHSKDKIYTYHSQIWADKAGYNVYLPALFIYNFKTTNFPIKVDEKTGFGFKLDSLSNKVLTKYPYGVALMQSPFWLIGHLASTNKDGFSFSYQKAIDVAGVFYLTIGLFFAFLMFKEQYSIKKSILLCFLLLFTTGIFYYGIFETGMSHIYSFCVLTMLLYLLLYKPKKIISIAFLSTLFLIIRPINVVFLAPLILYFIWINNNNYFNQSSLLKLTIKPFLIILIIVTALILPQLIYYNYAFGSYFTNSYQNEPFVFPSLVRITELLFSPNNGLLLFYVTSLLLVIYAFYVNSNFKHLLLFYFTSYVLIYASWWSLSLGCGFGHRAINDIFILFFIPLIVNKTKQHKTLLICLTIVAIINFKFIFSYDTCLHTSTNWNYTEYLSVLFGEFK